MDVTGDEIEAERLEIERGRTEIGQTIDEIQDRITPAAIAGRAGRGVVETAGGAGSKVKASIRSNPVPAVVTAAGIGYLLFKAFSGSSNGHSSTDAYGYEQDGGMPSAGGHVGANVDAVRSRVGDVVDSAASKIDDARLGVTQGAQAGAAGAQRVAAGAADRTSQAADMLRRAITSNPTAAVVVAMGIGAAAGMAMPETVAEQRVLGAPGEELVDRTREKMQEVGDRAKTAAAKAGETARQELGA